MSRHDSDTKPDLQKHLPGLAAPNVRVTVDIGGLTHRGKVKLANEDNFHVVRFGATSTRCCRACRPATSRKRTTGPATGSSSPTGLGGTRPAKSPAVGPFPCSWSMLSRRLTGSSGERMNFWPGVIERTEKRFQSVNAKVLAEAQGVPALQGMGTTLSLAMSLSDDLIVAHVGDSPVYLFRDGRLYRLTRDHTVAEQWGTLNPEAVRFRHMLTRAIGCGGNSSEPDVSRHRLANGDRLLLCTDGLTNMLEDEAITRELVAKTSSPDVCQALVDLALQRGGKDNVTVVVAAYNIQP